MQLFSFRHCSPQNMSFQTPCSTKLGRNKPNLGRLSAFSISYAGSFIIKIFWKYIWLLLRCLKTTNNVFLSFRIRVYISQCQFADYQLSETLQNEVQEDFVRNESHQFNMPFFKIKQLSVVLRILAIFTRILWIRIQKEKWPWSTRHVA